MPHAALTAGVLAIAAYLCLVNLDYAALWHDEAAAALIGRNLLEQGDIVGWDGRNLVGGTNGRTLNQDLRDVLPPLMYVINAAGFSLFGVNETGARIVPALIGMLSLSFLYLLLRQHLGNSSRLILFAFLLAAWSPQLLLYFRQSRYYAFMAFAVIAGFYLYERYWRTRKPAYLVALTLVAALSFFNHYAGGAATMLSLATWHVLFRARETTGREWLALAACGILVAALGTGYLAFVGVIGGERSGFSEFTGVTGIGEYRGTAPLVLLRIWIYTRDLFTADWISWPVFFWFVGMGALVWMRRRGGIRTKVHPTEAELSTGLRRQTAASNASVEARGDDLPVAGVGRIVLMGAFFALYSAALSVQPVWVSPVTDLRYYVAALPLLLPMKGVFVEWAWRKSKFAGATALAVLLLTSAGAAPFNMTMLFTGERTLGLHLFQFVREIHRPYRDSIRVVSDYLLEHAAQDDLVFVNGFANREALTFTSGHRVLFCCVLDDDSPLPRAKAEALRASLHVGRAAPRWIVIFGKPSKDFLERIEPHYAVAATLDVYYYPTQRPELNFHAFTPLTGEPGVHIMRLSAKPK